MSGEEEYVEYASNILKKLKEEMQGCSENEINVVFEKILFPYYYWLNGNGYPGEKDRGEDADPKGNAEIDLTRFPELQKIDENKIVLREGISKERFGNISSFLKMKGFNYSGNSTFKRVVS